ncbi:DUF2116 family Zn-ribbon domain-containing protein [archaeon]|nr:DUF2116 family Zn-ribbon domain-containing protein [archaeon]
MNPFYCRNCGKKIEVWDYRNKVFCSDMCRTQYSRKLKEMRARDPKRDTQGVTEQGGGVNDAKTD